jgi:hypothetical protein
VGTGTAGGTGVSGFTGNYGYLRAAEWLGSRVVHLPVMSASGIAGVAYRAITHL